VYVSFSDKTGCYGGHEGRRRAAVETENLIEPNKADDAPLKRTNFARSLMVV
jgi:hypothetical protein